MKSNPFKFLDRITWTKDELWLEEDQDDYVAFLINRHFSQFPDTVLYANDLNLRHDVLSKRMQFVYLVNSLPKRKRFGKWKKKTETEDLKAVSAYFQVNNDKAAELLPLVSESDLQQMRQYHEQSTGKSSKPVRRGSASKPR